MCEQRVLEEEIVKTQDEQFCSIFCKNEADLMAEERNAEEREQYAEHIYFDPENLGN